MIRRIIRMKMLDSCRNGHFGMRKQIHAGFKRPHSLQRILNSKVAEGFLRIGHETTHRRQRCVQDACRARIQTIDGSHGGTLGQRITEEET